MLDESSYNKTDGKYRTAKEVKHTLDNFTVHNKYQLVRLIRKNATTYLHENTVNNFYQQGKLENLILYFVCNL